MNTESDNSSYCSRPNVLLIYTDQQRWDSLGCYGNPLARTPNLDRLASKGALFTNFFVQNPVCMPSRMSMLTGRYCSSTGVGCNGPSFPQQLIPVNQLLKPYGYHTAQIGKLHFDPHAKRCHKDPTSTYGFDTFILSDEPGCYDDAYTKWVECSDPGMLPKVRTSLPAAAIINKQPQYSQQPRSTHEEYMFEGSEDFTHSAFVAEETCQFLKRHKNDRFFTISGFYAPHTPVNPPKKFIDMYNPEDMPLPKLSEEEREASPYKNLTPEKWQRTIAYYLALVSHVDDCVGKIIDTLEALGLFDKTLVIFTSDHGEFLGDHGRIQKGMPGHDCISKVPLIMSCPAVIKQGLKFNQLTEAVDILPTLLDYCCIQTPRFVQGKSLKYLMDGTVDSHKEDVLIEHFSPYGKREATVRTERYKYYCTSEGLEILFDLKADPHELRNVISDIEYTGVLSDMRKRLIIRLQKASFNGSTPEADY